MFKKTLIALFIFVASGATFAGSADFSQCNWLFANGKPPVIINKQTVQPRALCFSAFAIMHSGESRTPIYVVERLNKEQLIDAKDNKRTNRFFADARLPRAERAELEDYKNSGMDRGHMAPAGDMATPESMAQSFSLANMVPQAPINNRKAWAGIEKATRKYVMRAAGDVFVFSGPVFAEPVQKLGANAVWIPKYLYKLVYDQTTGRTWAHWIENTDEARVGKPITYDELVHRTGIQFLPGVHLQ